MIKTPQEENKPKKENESQPTEKIDFSCEWWEHFFPNQEFEVGPRKCLMCGKKEY